MHNKITSTGLIVGLAAFLYFPIFWNLTELPIPIYDEARVAVNAYEMSQNGNLIVTYFDGQPDMWNTKPPLFIWTQVAFIKLIGFNELALRLPSALASLFTCFLLLWFGIVFLRNKWIGIFSAMVLVTFQGYISFHVSRTGDYDALLILFMTGYALFYFCYLQSKKTKYFILSFLFLTLATLTKGIAALFFLPALAIYTLYKKSVFTILKQPTTYIGLISFLFMVVGYYLLREYYNDGYIKAVWNNELGGRFLEAKEDRSGSYFYYFQAQTFLYWMYFILPAFLVVMASKKRNIKQFALFTFIISLSFFIILSTAKTKHIWYIAPIFPILSIVIANFLYNLVQGINVLYNGEKTKFNKLISICFVAIVFAYPYYNILKKVEDPYLKYYRADHHQLSHFLKNIQNSDIDLNGFQLLKDSYSPNIDCYMIKLNEQKIDIQYGQKEYLKQGDKVLIWEESMRQYLDQNYWLDTILIQEANIQLYNIIEKKNY